MSVFKTLEVFGGGKAKTDQATTSHTKSIFNMADINV